MFFTYFPTYRKGKKIMGVLIITDHTLFYLKNITKILFWTKLRDIQKMQVYVGGQDPESSQPVYHLYVFTRKQGDFAFESD